MTSKIVTGFTTHTRFTPIKRTFRYDLSYLLINLSKVNELSKFAGFKWNGRNLFSVKDSTYLNKKNQPLITKLDDFLSKQANHIKYKNAYLLTTPEFLGKNFNPVSFFYLLDNTGAIIAIIAEVHNTYSEKHIYLLENPKEENNTLLFQSQKEFHVSPFFKTEGKYCFLFSKNLDRIDITINYFKGETKMFHANLTLSPKPIERFSFFSIGRQFIVTAIGTFPRILFQATILKVKHKLPHFKNTGLKSPQSSSRKKPSLLEKICMNLVIKKLNGISSGSLKLELPNGKVLTFGNQDQNGAIISVKSYKFFKRIVFGGDIGFANAYITGEWFTNNLEAIFQLFIENAHLTNQKNIFSSLSKLTYRIKHAYRKNSLTNSKKNIFEHYDLGNDFFQLFLDQHRVYSSGIFKTNEDSLETAQINKIEQALNLADVKPSHKILEIGSGWGALAIYAAQTIGCHVTTVTISEEQYNFVKKKINRLHLDDKIEVKLMDYRHLEGKYDRIVSIEMLEAVGHQYLPVFFKKCHQLLTVKGKALFQCIMIPDERYSAYLKSPDFIQTHIFPGGHLPSLEHIKQVVGEQRFNWVDCHTITKHYVPTLRAWDISFQEKINDIKALGFDHAFFNTWRYYFNYCAAGFDSDFIHNHQFLIQKCN